MKTAKQVTLDTGNSQILEMKIHRVSKSLVRISKREWKDVIHTEWGQKV